MSPLDRNPDHFESGKSVPENRPQAVPRKSFPDQPATSSKHPGKHPVGEPVYVAQGETLPPKVRDQPPAPVRVPGSGKTSGSFSQRATQVLGDPLLILEPTSTWQRFHSSPGFRILMLPAILLGAVIPAVILIWVTIRTLEGTRPAYEFSFYLAGVAVIFWLPFLILGINTWRSAKRMYVSVHQSGIYLRQAFWWNLGTKEFHLPFQQIQRVRSGKAVISEKPERGKKRNQPVCHPTDLVIAMQTGLVPPFTAFFRSFQPQSIAAFQQMLLKRLDKKVVRPHWD